MTNLDNILKSWDITLPTKVHIVRAMIVPLVMFRCECWPWRRLRLKNWCFWTVVLVKTLKSPLDFKDINPVNPKGNQPWIFIGKTEAEVPTLWPPDVKSWLIGKVPDAGKDWGQEEKGTTEDERVGWHHQLNGHASKQTLRNGEGQGSLACCSPWGRKQSDVP